MAGLKIHRKWIAAKSLLFVLGLLWMPCGLFAQPDSLFRQSEEVWLNFDSPAKLARGVRKKISGVRTKKGFLQRVEAVSAGMAAEGYPEFALDSFKIEQRVLKLWFHQGPGYFIDTIDPGNVNEEAALKADFEKISRKHEPLDWGDLKTRFGYCLKYYQDRGYPFAKFDSLNVDYKRDENRIMAQVNYAFDPGNLIMIDTIIFEGDQKEKAYFMRNLVNIQPGDMYDQSAIDAIPKVLNNTIYFKDTKPAKVTYDEFNRAKINVSLARRRAGKFDLLIGILPPRDETAKLQFTGLADFQLVSPLFKAGEILQFRFDKLVGSSQKMHLEYMHPYLFSTPVRLQMEFDLLKQDTTFLTRYFKFSGFYAFSQNLSVKAWTRSRTSTLISTERWELDSTTVPPVLDARDQTYGLGLLFENVDYKFNPTRGWIIRADFGIGRKRINQNPKLYEGIYDGLALSQPKREADFELWWFNRLSKRWVLALGNRTYWLDQVEYFRNDLLQVGGGRSIRGFNENEFFTNFYTMGTVEGRFLLERNSYLFVFSDYAYLENVSGPEKILRPWGIGLGMTYETRAGMVSVTYAAGQAGSQSFQPSRGRIHVGLINQF